MKHYIFGYGSLINHASLGRTLGRPVDPAELLPAGLGGYQRFWGLAERVVAAESGQTVRAVFLDIRPEETSHCNGVVVAVTDAEFDALRLRERNYDAVDITALLDAPPPDGRVTVFVGRAAHQIGATDPDGYVMQRYIDLVQTGVDRFGPGFSESFWRETVAHTFPVLTGAYSFV